MLLQQHNASVTLQISEYMQQCWGFFCNRNFSLAVAPSAEKHFLKTQFLLNTVQIRKAAKLNFFADLLVFMEEGCSFKIAM